MKTQIVDINNAAELDSFNAAHHNGHFLQTSLWGKVKNDWKWFGVICRNDSGEITGTLGVLLRKISGLPYHMMYAPRGPVCDFDDGETFAALIAAAKEEGKKYNAYELKIDKDDSDILYADTDILDAATGSIKEATKKDNTKSPGTFDPGVGVYALTAVLSVTGMAWVGRKKH